LFETVLGNITFLFADALQTTNQKVRSICKSVYREFWVMFIQFPASNLTRHTHSSLSQT